MFGFNYLLFRLLLLLGLFSSLTQSFRFELQPSRIKCITQDITSNSMSVGKYYIIPDKQGLPLPDSHKINVQVTSTSGNQYHWAEQVTSGEFAFTGVDGGDYVTCFSTNVHDTNLTIDFDWMMGVITKGWSQIVKKRQIDLLDTELLKMQGTVSSIRSEMHYLRSRENEMQKLNIHVNDAMFWFSLLSLLICLSVVGLQVCYLKNYFEREKVL